MSERNFPKYPKIKRLGHEDTKGIFMGNVVIEEKLDGSNFRWRLYQDRWWFGSRNTRLGDETVKIGGMFEHAVNYIKTLNKDVVRQIEKVYGELVFYGENMVPHTIKDYFWDKMPPVIGFDIYSLKRGRFLDNKTKRDIFEMMGVEVVPLIYEGPADEADGYIIVPHSVWRDGSAEGIVIKNYERQIFAKLVDEKFKEENAYVFASKKMGNPIVDKYVTSPRIEKIIWKLRDEGHPLDMTMMKYLPKAVYEDIIEEHGRDILMSNWVVDFKKTRKQIAKMSRKVLERMVVGNAVRKIRSDAEEDN